MTSSDHDRPESVLAAPGQDLAQLHARQELLARHGVNAAHPDAVFDDIADALAEATGFPYAMVNFHLDQQRFAGLHTPPPESGLPPVDRSMDIRHGWCPHVVKRKLGLPLHDVHASHRYSGNPVVDAIGINAYVGDPLIYPGTDIVLGTVCVIDVHKHLETDADRYMGLVEIAAAEVMADIRARPERPTEHCVVPGGGGRSGDMAFPHFPHSHERPGLTPGGPALSPRVIEEGTRPCPPPPPFSSRT
ncbi:GAF domain-containing protein [Streptomyces solisilvae]|uniref:GAF domain-containing protein n=1 Tax=Streptomyces malaysiensis TaxID=92644 RepID=UPI0036BF8C86